jgi:hypothetical protein
MTVDPQKAARRAQMAGARAEADARKEADKAKKGNIGLGAAGIVAAACLTVLQWIIEGRYWSAENLRRRVPQLLVAYTNANYVSTAFRGGVQAGCLNLIGLRGAGGRTRASVLFYPCRENGMQVWNYIEDHDRVDEAVKFLGLSSDDEVWAKIEQLDNAAKFDAKGKPRSRPMDEEDRAEDEANNPASTKREGGQNSAASVELAAALGMYPAGTLGAHIARYRAARGAGDLRMSPPPEPPREPVTPLYLETKEERDLRWAKVDLPMVNNRRAMDGLPPLTLEEHLALAAKGWPVDEVDDAPGADTRTADREAQDEDDEPLPGESVAPASHDESGAVWEDEAPGAEEGEEAGDVG